MRVLIVHCAYQFKGGEDTVVGEESTLLRNAGVTVEILPFSNEGSAPAKVLQLPFNWSAYRKTRKAIAAFCPDVVHIHNLHFAASPSVLYAAKHAGVPFVCTLHNYRLLCPSAILFHNGQPFLDSLERNFPWKAVRKGVYKNSKALTFWMAFSMQVHHWLGTWHMPAKYIALSGHASKIFQNSRLNLPAAQIVVKPNFCSLPLLTPQERGDDFLFVGRLSVEKGIPLLLQVFTKTNHRLIIAGDGPMKEEVIRTTQAHANITYVGSLKKEDLMRLMQQCTALVFPSIWYEGMPLTIIEAFACGLPVLATKLGAMEYMVTPGEDGLLFEAGNAQEVRAVLDEWQSFTPTEKSVFGLHARATYERWYTPEKNLQQLLAIYADVMARPTGRVNQLPVAAINN